MFNHASVEGSKADQACVADDTQRESHASNTRPGNLKPSLGTPCPARRTLGDGGGCVLSPGGRGRWVGLEDKWRLRQQLIHSLPEPALQMDRRRVCPLLRLWVFSGLLRFGLMDMRSDPSASSVCCSPYYRRQHCLSSCLSACLSLHLPV